MESSEPPMTFQASGRVRRNSSFATPLSADLTAPAGTRRSSWPSGSWGRRKEATRPCTERRETGISGVSAIKEGREKSTGADEDLTAAQHNGSIECERDKIVFMDLGGGRRSEKTHTRRHFN